MSQQKSYINRFFLTAAEVNAQREMPLSRIVTTIIDTATAHANIIGIGFDRMISQGISWVLSRLTIDILSTLSVNHTYALETWVQSTNRMFSERAFQMTDEDGTVVLRAHSTWMAVNMTTRRPGDLTPIFEGLDIINDKPYLGDKGGKLLPVANPDRRQAYTFAVSDIDVNRHVTTRRYIDLITDLWSLDHYDTARPARFEIAFKREARYGDQATVVAAPHLSTDDRPEVDTFDTEITVNETTCCLARIKFAPRQQQQQQQ